MGGEDEDENSEVWYHIVDFFGTVCTCWLIVFSTSGEDFSREWIWARCAALCCAVQSSTE